MALFEALIGCKMLNNQNNLKRKKFDFSNIGGAVFTQFHKLTCKFLKQKYSFILVVKSW